MAIRNIRQVGDPILRKTSKEVKEVNDRIKILLEDMAAVSYTHLTLPTILLV